MFAFAKNKQRTLKPKITSHLRNNQIISSYMSIEIGKRLLEERLRLGLNKAQMARLGCVADSAYKNYEEGKREPGGNFLAAIAAGGADVQYILTGIRSQQAVNAEPPANYAVLNKKRMDNLMDDLTAEEQAELIKQGERIRRLKHCEVELEEFKRKAG